MKTKRIFNYYYSNFSLEMTSKVETVGQKQAIKSKVPLKCIHFCRKIW